MPASDLPLEAYKMVADMIQSEEKLLWDRSQAFLVINAAMVTALGLIRRAQDSTAVAATVNVSRPNEFFLALCVIGALASFLWLTTIFRSEAFYNHWFEQLKFLERQYLDPIKTFQLADDYFTKGEITLGSEKFKLPREAKIIKIYHALLITSVGFLATWVLVALYTFL